MFCSHSGRLHQVYIRYAPSEHCRHRLYLSETLVGQLASSKVQDTGGKAPDICVAPSETKLSIHLLWSPART